MTPHLPPPVQDLAVLLYSLAVQAPLCCPIHHLYLHRHQTLPLDLNPCWYRHPQGLMLQHGRGQG
jgi:hypothetical protein